MQPPPPIDMLQFGGIPGQPLESMYQLVGPQLGSMPQVPTLMTGPSSIPMQPMVMSGQAPIPMMPMMPGMAASYGAAHMLQAPPMAASYGAPAMLQGSYAAPALLHGGGVAAVPQIASPFPSFVPQPNGFMMQQNRVPGMEEAEMMSLQRRVVETRPVSREELLYEGRIIERSPRESIANPSLAAGGAVLSAANFVQGSPSYTPAPSLPPLPLSPQQAAQAGAAFQQPYLQQPTMYGARPGSYAAPPIMPPTPMVQGLPGPPMMQGLQPPPMLQGSFVDANGVTLQGLQGPFPGLPVGHQGQASAFAMPGSLAMPGMPGMTPPPLGMQAQSGMLGTPVMLTRRELDGYAR